MQPKKPSNLLFFYILEHRFFLKKRGISSVHYPETSKNLTKHLYNQRLGLLKNAVTSVTTVISQATIFVIFYSNLKSCCFLISLNPTSAPIIVETPVKSVLLFF